MDIVDEFPGEFFRATDLSGKRLPLTIAGVEKREMRDGKMKPVVVFVEDPRGLVLNVENRSALIDRFGRETDGWVGKQVTLLARRVRGPNGPTQGIRLADGPTSEVLDDDLPPNMMGDESESPAKTRRGFSKPAA
jgi:hypothetical protein